MRYVTPDNALPGLKYLDIPDLARFVRGMGEPIPQAEARLLRERLHLGDRLNHSVVVRATWSDRDMMRPAVKAGMAAVLAALGLGAMTSTSTWWLLAAGGTLVAIVAVVVFTIKVLINAIRSSKFKNVSNPVDHQLLNGTVVAKELDGDFAADWARVRAAAAAADDLFLDDSDTPASGTVTVTSDDVADLARRARLRVVGAHLAHERVSRLRNPAERDAALAQIHAVRHSVQRIAEVLEQVVAEARAKWRELEDADLAAADQKQSARARAQLNDLLAESAGDVKLTRLLWPDNPA